VTGPLNLQDADLKGFEAVDPGRINAEIFEITMDAVKNPGGATPIGTPMMKVQFRATADNPEYPEGIENRRFFTQYVVPPKDHPKEKAQKMKDMIARFFIALGFKEEEVLSKNFEPDFEDLKGRPCVIVVGKEPKLDRNRNVVEGEYNNPVKGVKPAGSIVAGPDSGLL
jgi:hypothetical protein